MTIRHVTATSDSVYTTALETGTDERQCDIGLVSVLQDIE